VTVYITTLLYSAMTLRYNTSTVSYLLVLLPFCAYASQGAKRPLCEGATSWGKTSLGRNVQEAYWRRGKTSSYHSHRILTWFSCTWL